MNEPIENEAVESKNHLQSPSQLPLELEQRRGFHLFYIFPILYVLSAYLLPGFFMIQEKPFSYLVYSPAFFGVMNIIVSIVFCKPENRRMMFNALVFVKYAMIPFFIIGGLALAASFLLSFIPVPFMVFIFLPITAIGAVGGWLILALEAPYAISYLRLAAKAGTCRTGLAVLFGVLQFFFTVDVIAVMILTFIEGKWKKLTITLFILMFLMIILIVLLLILGFLGVLSTS